MAAPKVSGTRVILEGSSSTTATLNAPTREAGNGLLTSLWLQSTSATPATPSGWALLTSVARGALFKEWFYVRIADNTATDNFSTSWAGSTFRFGEMRRITGCTTTLGDWLVGTTSNGTGTVATVNGLTTVSAENLLIGNWGTLEEVSIESATGGWTDDAAFWTPVFTKEQAAKGETGSLEITFAGAGEQWIAVMIAIPPPPAGAPSSPLPGSLALLGVGR